MRAGYDRVYSDIRRPPIPDLPVDMQDFSRLHEQQFQAYSAVTSIVLVALLAGLLFLLFLTVTSGRVSSIAHFSSASALVQGGKAGE